MASSTWQRRCIALLLIASVCLVQAAEARKRKKTTANFDDYVFVLKWVLIAMIAPALGMAIYAVIRDPVMPHIAKELWYRIQEKLTGKTIDPFARESREHEA